MISVRASLVAGLVLALAMTGAEAGKRKVPLGPKPEPQDSVLIETRTATRLPPIRTLQSAWIQYGPQGVLEARAVVTAEVCPDLVLDLKHVDMQKRSASDTNFRTVCWAPIPATARQAAIAFAPEVPSPPPLGSSEAAEKAWIEKLTGLPQPAETASREDWLAWQRAVIANVKWDVVPLPIPVSDPQRIVVIGDGGCRSKGTLHQDCADPEKWAFARVAAEAAKLKPDLVIHVGDYVSREYACPADVAVCQNQPFGDNWPAWDADFFTPAKPLLAVAPWVVTRGNHEDCNREGLGFLRLLGPAPFDPAAACIPHLPPYSVSFAGLNLVVSDDADAPEASVVAPSVPVYRAEIASLAKEKAPTWWVQHRPIWGLVSGPLGVPIGGNQTLIAAAGTDGIPAPVELMLSGHVHTFEAINYDAENHLPPQLVAGRGGDLLDPTPEDLRGAIFQGSSGVGVHDGLSIGGFGFVLMTREEAGWRLDVYDFKGHIERVCRLRDRRLDCPHKNH